MTHTVPATDAGPPALRVLERVARILRAVGLGAVVDRAALGVGGAVARRQTVDVEGLALRGNHAGHLWYLREIASGRESLLTEVARRAVVPGRLAVDGGAQLGLIALTMARAGARVIAFEPNVEVQPALRANVARNGLDDRVVVRPAALGASAGRGFLSGEGDGSTLAHGTGRPVEIVALDDELRGEAPAVVKLDLEGWEVEAIRGMPETLAGDAVLLVECNPDALADAGSSPAALLEALGGHGYEAWLVDEDAWELRPLAAPPATGYVNLLFARPATARRLADAVAASGRPSAP